VSLVDTVPSYPTLMTMLQQDGYRTNLVGTTDFVSGGHSLKARLGAWLRSSGLGPVVTSGPRTDVNGTGPRANVTDWCYVDAATRWLGDAAQDTHQPFFLSLGVRCPHPYRTTSAYWLDRVDADAIVPPPIDEHPHPMTCWAQRQRRCDRTFTDDQQRFLRQRYVAMIAEADAMLGQLITTMDHLGLWDSTYLVFLSDHGEMNLEHNMVFKGQFYEPAARVPLMMAGPGIECGRSVDRCVSLVDVVPTLRELAGVEAAALEDGRSLVEAILGKQAPRCDEVFSEYHANSMPTGGYMLRQGPWKYVAYVGTLGQLFHLPDDPFELSNCIDSHREQALAMDRRLREIVDIEAVDARARADDRTAFAAWRGQQDDETLGQTLRDVLGRWDDDTRDQIDAWLHE